MCRWGCLKTDTTYRCKFCGIRYCINCLCGDFPGKMYAPNLCRRCNQKNHRGQKVNCDDAFSEAAQKVITMQKVIKAAKGGDRNRSYLRLPIKPKGANNATAANSKSEADEKKDDSKSKNKVNVSGVKSKIDTGNHQKEDQVAQQKAATVADEDGKATKPVKKLKKKKSSRESIAAAQPKAVNTADTSQKVVKKVNTANTSQKVVKKVKSKVTSKEGATKTTVKKKKKQAAA